MIRPLRLALGLSLLGACSPSPLFAEAPFEPLRLEPGESVEFDVRLCVDGPRTQEPVRGEARMDVYAEDDDALASVAASVSSGDPGARRDDVESQDEVSLAGWVAQELFVDLDGSGPWASESGRRCGPQQLLRVTLDEDSNPIWVSGQIEMSMDYGDGDDDLEIELGDPRVVGADDAAGG